MQLQVQHLSLNPWKFVVYADKVCRIDSKMEKTKLGKIRGMSVAVMFLMVGMLAAMPVMAEEVGGSISVPDALLISTPAGGGGGSQPVLITWAISIGMLAQPVTDSIGNVGTTISIDEMRLLLERRSDTLYAETLLDDGSWQVMDATIQATLASILSTQDPALDIEVTRVVDSQDIVRNVFAIPLPVEPGEYTWSWVIEDHPDESVWGKIWGLGYYQIVWYEMTVIGEVYLDITTGLGTIPGPEFPYNGLNKGVILTSAGLYAQNNLPQGSTRAVSTMLIILSSTGGAWWDGGVVLSARGGYQGNTALPLLKRVSMTFSGVL